MEKIDITRTELVWPGKYNEDGTLRETPRVSLPFQVIETVNESRATREARKSASQGTLFDIWEGKEGDTFEDGWKNKLIWGDNLLVMGSLLEKLAGKVDLIYIDPPFATGADFSFSARIGESDETAFKEQSILEEKAYRDTWGNGTDSFIAVIYERLLLMRELLSDSGSIYVHCDWRVNSQIRMIMDEIFGHRLHINENIWSYKTGGIGSRWFSRKHDTIYSYARSDGYKFKPQKEKSYLTSGMANAKEGSPTSIKYGLKRDKGGTYRMATARDVWDIGAIYRNSPELIGYPTQKPEALLERILSASSDRGDLVADFFCGSGTSLAVAEKLGRRWIGCDLGRWAIHVTRKRMLGIEKCKPFEVLNLGKYERQYWQGATFAEGEAASFSEKALYEYLAFVLKLYGARPVAGMTHLHGKKGRAMVRVGAVDAPVTIGEVLDAVDECVKLKQNELHVLGWEWEMGLRGTPILKEAGNRGVKLVLLWIPREVMETQAADRGDVTFFELAYLDAAVRQPKRLTGQVALANFVIANTELIPDNVRGKVSKWSDYIDYWAVDWDFRNDTFMQDWVAYRTRKERKLPLSSDPHTYEQPGTYRVLVKVIDIFGNDTSREIEVQVQ